MWETRTAYILAGKPKWYRPFWDSVVDGTIILK
jgi:hypothetical protein